MKFSEKNLNNILKAISEVNHILNEQMTLHFIADSSTCPDCDIDPVLNESTNPFCETCEGTGKVEIQNSITIPCSVEEDISDADEYEHTKIGEWRPSNLLVTIDIKEINDYSIDLDLVERFEFRGNMYSIVKKVPNSLQGYIYEYVLELKKMY